MVTRRHLAARVDAYTELIDYPCSKQELLQMANEQEFPDSVLDVLEELPNRYYPDEESVMAALESAGLSRETSRLTQGQGE